MPRRGQAKTRRQNARRFAFAEIAWRPHAARNQVRRLTSISRPAWATTQQQIGEFESRSTIRLISMDDLDGDLTASGAHTAGD